MPIKKIAELVHYKNQCTLSELVKKHIGISLLQYLNLEPEKQHRIIHRTKADQNAVLKVLPKTCIREDLIPDLFNGSLTDTPFVIVNAIHFITKMLDTDGIKCT